MGGPSAGKIFHTSTFRDDGGEAAIAVARRQVGRDVWKTLGRTRCSLKRRSQPFSFQDFQETIRWSVCQLSYYTVNYFTQSLFIVGYVRHPLQATQAASVA